MKDDAAEKCVFNYEKYNTKFNKKCPHIKAYTIQYLDQYRPENCIQVQKGKGKAPRH